MSRRRYEELAELDSFEERFEYLRLDGKGGEATFGSARYMNQAFYMSEEWHSVRNDVIIRDNGCDLGIPGREIHGVIYVHHIVPLTRELFSIGSPLLIDPDNLICVSYNTHKAIHYGDASMLALAEPVIRRPNDTCPWKGGKL